MTVPFDGEHRSIDEPQSIWVIVNKWRPLRPRRYRPSDLVHVGNKQQLRAEAARAFGQLVAAADHAGVVLEPLSGFRSYADQKAVHRRAIAREGRTEADRLSATSGTSEHQTGLAIDVARRGHRIEMGFGTTAEGIWLAANAYRHGFAIRYQDGKEPVTGYRYEPWHIRYFGTALADRLHRTGQSAEEWFGLIPP